MKILAIRLKNLASLGGPFELDFTAEPLASAGLFAITGPTGAGKSTLLDALCLALFGAVPRLGDIGQSKVPEIDQDISTGDPRTLLRRGTGSGYAEVDFVGVDQRRYRARWETNRARDHAGKKLQASRQTLIDLDSQQILSQGKAEYRALLEARLGLNFEQFTRAVMLAQSQFSAFLKADDKERSELLEKLTDTAIYSQLGKRAYLKSQEAAQHLRELESQHGMLAPLDTEQRSALEQELTEARQRLNDAQGELRQLESRQQWLNELHRLDNEHQQALAQLEQARQQQDALDEQRQTAERLAQLAPQRHLFARRTTLDAQLADTEQRLGQLDEQRQRLQHQQSELEGRALEAQSALERARHQQQEAAPQVRLAFDEQSALARQQQSLTPLQAQVAATEHASRDGLAALRELEQRQAEQQAELDGISEALQQNAPLSALAKAWDAWRPRLQQTMALSARLAKGREELPGLEQQAIDAERVFSERHAQQQALYDQAEVKADAVHAEVQRLGEQLRDYRRQHAEHDSLDRLWQRHRELATRIADTTAQQRQASERRATAIDEGKRLKTEHDAAEQALAVTVELLRRQQLARGESVEQLRAALQEGQPCPVCGSEAHPYRHDEALLQRLDDHDQQEQATAQARLKALAERLAELRAEVGGLNTRLKEFQPQLESLANASRTVTPELEAHPLHGELLAQPEDWRVDWLPQRLQELAGQISFSESRQQQLLAVQQQAAALQQQVQEAREGQQAAMQRLEEQQRNISLDNQQLEDALREFAAVLPENSLPLWRTQPTEAFMALDQQVAERLAQLDRQHDQREELDARARTLDVARSDQQHRDEALTQQRQQLVNAEAQLQQSRDRLAALLGEQPDAEHWQQALEQAVEQARQVHARLGEELQQARDALVRSTSEHAAQAQHGEALDRERQTLRATLDEWLAQHGALDEATLTHLLGFSDDDASAQRQRLQHADRAMEHARVLEQERRGRVEQHRAQHEQPVDAEQLAASLPALQERVAALDQHSAELRGRLAEDDRRVQASLALQARIEQARAERLRWGRLEEVIGSATGDRFRKIAQAYNLDLLVHHANSQLRQLARRYRLQRGGSALGLLVMDTEMGDELRSVHSLSGGETFLVSLALALGLASMASNTLRIESLFIDEGFGSLDPESLQLAMDALDGLQAQGRKVGVISHVQEMHERIPVQIRVRRQGNGLSTLEVDG